MIPPSAVRSSIQGRRSWDGDACWEQGPDGGRWSVRRRDGTTFEYRNCGMRGRLRDHRLPPPSLPPMPMPQTRESPLRYTAGRLRRHLRWARTQGLGRLLEEDDLNPLARASRRVAKWRWRRAHGSAPGTATAVLLVGLQRSGTNMVVRGLERAPEFEVYNENHSAAFDRFQLRPIDHVRGLLEASRHPY